MPEGDYEIMENRSKIGLGGFYKMEVSKSLEIPGVISANQVGIGNGKRRKRKRAGEGRGEERGSGGMESGIGKCKRESMKCITWILHH